MPWLASALMFNTKRLIIEAAWFELMSIRLFLQEQR